MDVIITILPVVTKDLPISPRFTPYNFFIAMQVQHSYNSSMVEFYLLTFPRFPLRKKEHKSYFGKNRTHDFRTSRCAAYLLDHSGRGCKAPPQSWRRAQEPHGKTGEALSDRKREVEHRDSDDADSGRGCGTLPREEVNIFRDYHVVLLLGYCTVLYCRTIDLSPTFYFDPSPYYVCMVQ